MTVPVSSQSGDMRQALAEALVAMWEVDAGEPLSDLPETQETVDTYLETLLPVVQRLCDQARADELRQAADELDVTPVFGSFVKGKRFAVGKLRARADALTTDTPPTCGDQHTVRSFTLTMFCELAPGHEPEVKHRNHGVEW